MLPTYPQSGGLLRVTIYGGRKLRTAAVKTVELRARLRVRGAAISKRTKLVLVYVREGAYTPQRRTPVHLRAVNCARELAARFPVMCAHVQTMYMMQRQQDSVTARMKAVRRLVATYTATHNTDQEFFSPDELGL